MDNPANHLPVMHTTPTGISPTPTHTTLNTQDHDPQIVTKLGVVILAACTTTHPGYYDEGGYTGV